MMDSVLVFMFSIGAGVLGIVGIVIGGYVLWARQQEVKNRGLLLIGNSVRALTPLSPDGRVRYAGEDWAAVLEPGLPAVEAGEVLEVTAVDGLCLHVRPLAISQSIPMRQQSRVKE